MREFFELPWVWLLTTLALLAACTFLPIRIHNDVLRSRVMRWVLVPVSLVIIFYTYPVGIQVFRRLALTL